MNTDRAERQIARIVETIQRDMKYSQTDLAIEIEASTKSRESELQSIERSKKDLENAEKKSPKDCTTHKQEIEMHTMKAGLHSARLHYFNQAMQDISHNSATTNLDMKTCTEEAKSQKEELERFTAVQAILTKRSGCIKQEIKEKEEQKKKATDEYKRSLTALSNHLKGYVSSLDSPEQDQIVFYFLFSASLNYCMLPHEIFNEITNKNNLREASFTLPDNNKLIVTLDFLKQMASSDATVTQLSQTIWNGYQKAMSLAETLKVFTVRLTSIEGTLGDCHRNIKSTETTAMLKRQLNANMANQRAQVEIEEIKQKSALEAKQRELNKLAEAFIGSEREEPQPVSSPSMVETKSQPSLSVQVEAAKSSLPSAPIVEVVNATQQPTDSSLQQTVKTLQETVADLKQSLKLFQEGMASMQQLIKAQQENSLIQQQLIQTLQQQLSDAKSVQHASQAPSSAGMTMFNQLKISR